MSPALAAALLTPVTFNWLFFGTVIGERFADLGRPHQHVGGAELAIDVEDRRTLRREKGRVQ